MALDPEGCWRTSDATHNVAAHRKQAQMLSNPQCLQERTHTATAKTGKRPWLAHLSNHLTHSSSWSILVICRLTHVLPVLSEPQHGWCVFVFFICWEEHAESWLVNQPMTKQMGGVNWSNRRQTQKLHQRLTYYRVISVICNPSVYNSAILKYLRYYYSF